MACWRHWFAGGIGFLVRTELLEQGLFLDFGSISIVGLSHHLMHYKKEAIVLIIRKILTQIYGS